MVRIVSIATQSLAPDRVTFGGADPALVHETS